MMPMQFKATAMSANTSSVATSMCGAVRLGSAVPMLGASLGLVLALLWPCLAQAELSVSMATDHAQVPLDGRLVLQIEVSTDSLRGPDVGLPDLTDFEVIQQSVQRPMQFSFGLGGQQVKSSTKYTFVLRPLHEGRIELEPATAQQDGKQVKSQSLVIQVGSSGGAQALGRAKQGRGQHPDHAPGTQARPSSQPAADAKIVDHGNYVDAQAVDAQAFIRTIVDNATPYEGQQVTVTMYLYARDRLGTAPTIDQEPGTTGFWTHDLLEGQTLEQLRPQRVGNQRYHVYLLRRFAAFALRAGEHSIGPMALTIARPANVFSMFGRGGGAKPPLKRTGVALPISVKALPAKGKPINATVVGRFAIDATLDRTQTATGDAVTLTATLSGRGHIQGAKITLPSVPGIEALQPQVRDLVETTEDQLGGSRVYEWLLVPKEPGNYVLPRLTLHTFDPDAGQYKQIQGPALSLVAAGQAVATSSLKNDEQALGTGPDSSSMGALTDQLDSPLVFGPLRTQSRLVRKQHALRDAPWFTPLLLIPLVALVAFASWDLLQKRRLAAPKNPQQLALTASNLHMAAASEAADAGNAQLFFGEVHDAILKALESRRGSPVGSCTRNALSVHFSNVGLSEADRKELLAILDRCDSARFAPGGEDAAGLKQILESARARRTALLSTGRSVAGGTA